MIPLYTPCADRPPPPLPPRPVPDDPDADVDEEVQGQLTADFEIGHYIRERIVPRAVLYFTGEALEEDDYDDEEEEEEEDGEEGSESSRDGRGGEGRLGIGLAD